jgi:hypothetical protein
MSCKGVRVEEREWKRVKSYIWPFNSWIGASRWVWPSNNRVGASSRVWPSNDRVGAGGWVRRSNRVGAGSRIWPSDDRVGASPISKALRACPKAIKILVFAPKIYAKNALPGRPTPTSVQRPNGNFGFQPHP